MSGLSSNLAIALLNESRKEMSPTNALKKELQKPKVVKKNKRFAMSLDFTPYTETLPNLNIAAQLLSMTNSKRNLKFQKGVSLRDNTTSPGGINEREGSLNRDFTQSSLYSSIFGTGEDKINLLQSKYNRQTVERGLMLIENRVKLLSKDEEKITRMISETRRKAQ